MKAMLIGGIADVKIIEIESDRLMLTIEDPPSIGYQPLTQDQSLSLLRQRPKQYLYIQERFFVQKNPAQQPIEHVFFVLSGMPPNVAEMLVSRAIENLALEIKQ